MADPRAPAMSRSATSANDATARCSSRRHRVLLDPFEEPVAERRFGLDHAAAEQVHVGIGEVGPDREQTAERHRLLLEDVERHLVAALPEVPYPLRRVERLDAREFVIG